MKKNIFLILIFALLIVLIYKVLFLFLPISGGDYIMVTVSQLFTWKFFSFNVWNTNLGLGWALIPLLSFAPYTIVLGWIGSMAGNGIIAERFILWIPFLIISIISSYFLSKLLFKKPIFSLIAPLIYLFNTYILIIIGGGQIAGIGLAYAFAPFVVLSFVSLLNRPSFYNALITGIVLAISVMFDLRMTYVVLVGVLLYMLIKFCSMDYTWGNAPGIVKNLSFIFVIPGITTFLLHAFWLIPMAIVRQNPLQQLGSAYNTLGAVRFFSFAKFEDALGLLHPNWPENIFGKVGFMKPEFLLLPILAFSSLIFINKKVKNDEEKKEKLHVIYFALLGLVGIFLAKGANDPFGGVYLWMFKHIPGFIMFRDPTKWYLLIAISYSMLIPFSVSKIYEFLKRRFA